MIMTVIPRDEAEQVLDALIEAGHTATFIETKGGMLRQSQYSLFIGVKREDVNKVIKIIQESCIKNAEVDIEFANELNQEMAASPPKLGGAIIFVWSLDKTQIF